MSGHNMVTSQIQDNKDEAYEEDEGCKEDGTSSSEEDCEEDYDVELNEITETLDPNLDEEVFAVIEAVKEHFKMLNQIRKTPTANIPEKDLEHGNDVEDQGGENFLDNSDVESLHEETLEDGSIELMRTPARFPRYNENCRTVTFFIGLSFIDHKQFKKALLKYAVQEKRDFKFVKNANSRVRVKCIDDLCKWMVYAANEEHHNKKYFLVKTLNEEHT